MDVDDGHDGIPGYSHRHGTMLPLGCFQVSRHHSQVYLSREHVGDTLARASGRHINGHSGMLLAEGVGPTKHQRIERKRSRHGNVAL